jgi:predicted P-loop ATPase
VKGGVDEQLRFAEYLRKWLVAMVAGWVDERAPYASFADHRKHIASFCGTGNNVQFLSDSTGTRRWLPFEVESIMSPRDNPFNYAGIYAQAYALYQEGFHYWFSPQEIRQLAQHNSQFETPKDELDLVNRVSSLLYPALCFIGLVTY